MAKTDTAAQHDALHNVWPHSCCLCRLEDENASLRKRLEAAERRGQLWRVLASPAWVGDESEGRFQCLCCNQFGKPNDATKTIVHLPDCEYAAALKEPKP